MLQLQRWLMQQLRQSWKSHTRQQQWLQPLLQMLQSLYLRPERPHLVRCMCLHARCRHHRGKPLFSRLLIQAQGCGEGSDTLLRTLGCHPELRLT